MKIFKKIIKKFLTKIRNFLIRDLDSNINKLLMLNAQIIANNKWGGEEENKEMQKELFIEDFEFSIYSQNGEDGILDFLITYLNLDSPKSPYPKAFIEFGVQNYLESNTRFLLKKRNWKGLILDSSFENINYIKNDEIYWRFDIEAKEKFITKNNINQIINSYLESKKIDNVALLSIDIDGVDYFIWEEIEIVPAIVVIEYNALFGIQSICIPYRDDFDRFKSHHSGLYFGASIEALIQLAAKKQYKFVGADSSGTNLFFIHNSFKEKIKFIKTHPLKDYCTRHNVRQSRDKYGNLTYKSILEMKDEIMQFHQKGKE